MLDESDSTRWKNQSILLFDVSLNPCNVSCVFDTTIISFGGMG